MATKNLPDKETLDKAAGLLQAAHDFIEANGFNIDTYSGVTYSYGANAPRCYIGVLRTVAGVYPAPIDGVADAGDGPELTVALKAMDKVAKRRLPTDVKQQVRKEREEVSMVGRFVEQLGFEVQNRFRDKPPNDRRAAERDYALKLLRTALTEIHK